MANGDFVFDLQKVRQQAREHMENGPVTEDYSGNLDVLVKILNEALATELVCVLRYKRHQFSAKGIHSKEEHANDMADLLSSLDGKHS